MYIRERARHRRPLSVLISHQFLLWRTRGPGSKKPSWCQPSRCLDPATVVSVSRYSSRRAFDTDRCSLRCAASALAHVREIESEIGLCASLIRGRPGDMTLRQHDAARLVNTEQTSPFYSRSRLSNIHRDRPDCPTFFNMRDKRHEAMTSR